MDLRDKRTPIDATVMVLTRNSEATLEQALLSVEDFAEIIICDGDSTDTTLDIAEAHGAIVLRQDPKFTDGEGRLLDYAGARHQIVEHASKPWILHLDADEIATPQLVDAIAALDGNDASTAAYRCGARHIADGETIRSAANYPMSFMRVFRRDAVTGYFGPINEHPEFADDAIVDRIDGEFLIPMPPLRIVLRKWARYQRIVTRDARETPDLDAVRELRSGLRVTKWLAWRTWKTRSSETGPHMPLRYDVARVGFHMTTTINTFGTRVLSRLAARASDRTATVRKNQR